MRLTRLNPDLDEESESRFAPDVDKEQQLGRARAVAL